jgi:light-independent protochlorophyllide reductase subunit B
VFIFADATHAIAAARIASEELAFEVVGLGTYSREQARSVRARRRNWASKALITDNYLEVEHAIAEAQPELVLGTQMERHIAKRLGIPCAVISTPAHVQDYPARYSPQMGHEGANVIFDSWVHPLMMGLEEHLLAMFREDFEFHDKPRPRTSRRDRAATAGHGASGRAWRARLPRRTSPTAPPLPTARPGTSARKGTAQDSLLRARQGAAQHGTLTPANAASAVIKVDTLYEAKAHFSR